jgi:DNA (cytosine-5)-methyltransferase 1
MLELFPRFKINKPVRLIELFAGYGSQALALNRLGINFEHHQVVEFDKYAIKTYNALHDTNFKTQDITKVKHLDISETNKYDYILTYSFPCTDLSLAGKRGGMTKGSGTSSGLLWEVERLLIDSKELPQVLVMENVPAIHSVKFNDQFRMWQNFLSKLGYSNHWQDLNAKDYGIPQNRVRTFMVSVLGDYEYHFPKPFALKDKLKDMLEKEVDDKYFLTEKLIKTLSKKTEKYDRSVVFKPHEEPYETCFNNHHESRR